MGKYDVSLEQLGLDDLVAAHPVTVATTFEPPEQPPVRQPVAPKPSGRLVVGPAAMQYSDRYSHLRSYISWAGWLGKHGHYFGFGMILLAIVRDSHSLLTSGLLTLMASMMAFAIANLLQIAIDSKNSLSVIENKIRS